MAVYSKHDKAIVVEHVFYASQHGGKECMQIEGLGAAQCRSQNPREVGIILSGIKKVVHLLYVYRGRSLDINIVRKVTTASNIYITSTVASFNLALFNVQFRLE